MSPPLRNICIPREFPGARLPSEADSFGTGAHAVSTDMESYGDSPWPGSFSYSVPKGGSVVCPQVKIPAASPMAE